MQKVNIALALMLIANESTATIVLHETQTTANQTPLNDVMAGDFFSSNITTNLGGPDTSAEAYPVFTRTFTFPGVESRVPGFVTFQSFGFVTGTANNTAATVRLRFTYLGADGVFNGASGGDDLLIGDTEAFTWNDGLGNGTGWEGAGLYYVNFATTPSALIDGLGDKFRIAVLTPSTSARVQFKSTGSGYTTLLNNAKLGFSGTFTAIPEPCSMLFYGGIGGVLTLLRRRPCSAPRNAA